MREILFRAKRQATNEWVYGYFVNEYYDFQIYLQPQIITLSGREYVNENTLGQFTGLTDKNGVKIFEGDIVSLGGVNYPVIFNTLGRCAEFALTDGVPFGFDYVHVPMEVVGNIYDTPELLGEDGERNDT